MSQEPLLSATKSESLLYPLIVHELLEQERAYGDPTWRPVTIQLSPQDRHMDRRHLGVEAVTDDILRLALHEEGKQDTLPDLL